MCYDNTKYTTAKVSMTVSYLTPFFLLYPKFLIIVKREQQMSLYSGHHQFHTFPLYSLFFLPVSF